MIDWTSLEQRASVLEDIYGSQENKNRKAESFQQYEIFNDRLSSYVKGELVRQLSQKTADSMPICDTVNICKKIAKSEGSIYANPPDREFTEISDADLAAMTAIYTDGKFNVKFKKSNWYFRLQNQGLIQIIPKQKKIMIRVLLPHNYDVVPNDEHPEVADAILVSAFDKTNFIGSDGVNQIIADRNDDQKLKDRFTVWTNDYNFTMNGKGEITSGEDVKNEIGELPFVDIFHDKEFEYFVRQGSTLADFTIAHNVDLSDLSQISRIQGYAQAYWKGENIPEEMKVGPTHILHLPPNANSNDTTEFGFANPSPNIESSIKVIVLKLANYLSSRGVDTNSIQTELNASKTYASGLERLLAMIEKFEASRDDMDLYQHVEQRVFEITKKWLLYSANSDLLDRKYQTSVLIKDAMLTVKFAKPESVETESEKIDSLDKRIGLGISDKVDALMKLDGLTEEQAIERIKKLQERAIIVGQTNQQNIGAPGGQNTKSEAF